MTAVVENTPRSWSARASGGASWEAAGWSERGQTRRFLAVLEHAGAREGDTLLDFGCGTGRLCTFLPDGVVYTGFDWADGMLSRARADHPSERFVSVVPDELFDHVVVVGAFNLGRGWSRESTWKALAELWGTRVRRTMVASLYRGEDPQCLAYAPQEAAEFARRMGCRRFAIDCTSLGNDLILEMSR